MKKILGTILVIVIIVAALGIALGFYYKALPEHNPQGSKEVCESVGGEWSVDECLLSHKKAGEDCTDGGQCESGICSPSDLTEEQKASLENDVINNIIGKCYSGELVGCVEQVIMGSVSKESMCLEE